MDSKRHPELRKEQIEKRIFKGKPRGGVEVDRSADSRGIIKRIASRIIPALDPIESQKVITTYSRDSQLHYLGAKVVHESGVVEIRHSLPLIPSAEATRFYFGRLDQPVTIDNHDQHVDYTQTDIVKE
ncbi:hypothetical protein KC950_01855 [Candidatus Saccharibacteria bacterium]|nr:hypothetical protein [Candidatus Saccharibacteria bacterium]